MMKKTTFLRPIALKNWLIGSMLFTALAIPNLSYCQANLNITESFSGQDGTKLTADWFEIKNTGNSTWVSGVDSTLYYDDESVSALDADAIFGIDSIPAGASVVVIITGDTADITKFKSIWSPVIDLSNVQVGYTDGAGLGAGGDGLAIWLGDPNLTNPVDSVAYPSTAANDGQTYDYVLSAFSTVNNANGAVQTIALGGNASSVPNIGSPGDGPAIPIEAELIITEIFSGQSGTDLTADWFEIKNIGQGAWVSGVDSVLFYDDDSQDAGTADTIFGISTILPGTAAIVLVTDDTNDINTFVSVWGPVADLNGIEIGYTDGAGLGGTADMVTLWLGNPNLSSPIDTASYDNAGSFDGQSYDSDLAAYSTVLNANGAVQTIALGGAASTIPNIGSPGNQGPNLIDPNAPIVTGNSLNALPYLNIPTEGVAYVASDINDPTDRVQFYGIPFSLSDLDNSLDSLKMSATSSNQTVVADADLVFSGTGANRLLKINPSTLGYTTITVTVTDSSAKTGTYSIDLAVSDAVADSSTSRFHVGSSDGSTAITINDSLMWVADDENQVIRMYNRYNSGLPLYSKDFTPQLPSSSEVDIESSFEAGNTIFWMGSHTNATRGVIFSTSVSGTGVNSELTYTGYYNSLLADISNWDANNTHGKGANFYGLSAGIEIEAMTLDPNNTNGALIALRAPVINGKVLILPVTNFQTMVSLTPTSGSAIIGTPMLIELLDHTPRSIECNANGCAIIAGPAGNATGFSLFTWSGNANDVPELRAADLNSKTNHSNIEGIVGIPSSSFLGANGDSLKIQVLIDAGVYDYYGDGKEAKSLDHAEWKKCRSEWVTIGSTVVPPVANPGDIVFNEIMIDPSAVTDTNGEWFELINNTTDTIDLNGWTVSDNNTDQFTINNNGSLLIMPNGYLVFGVNDDSTSNGGVNLDYAYTASSMTLDNGTDSLLLIAPDSIVINKVIWDGGTSFPNPVGASIALQQPSIDNSNGSNWCEATTIYGSGDYGTPGSINDCAMPMLANLKITEIYNGQSGTKLTADWFEIKNVGSSAWNSTTDPALFYDDESTDPLEADTIHGIQSILPGATAIVIIGDQNDTADFRTVWSPVTDLSGVEIGFSDGAGLSGGGDMVTLWMGDPNAAPIDTASYPDGAPFDGQTYDVTLRKFSTVGNENDAVQTTALGGSSLNVPNIGSPGKAFTKASFEGLRITEIFSGQEGTDLTADWFEIENTGSIAWVSGVSPDLYYDDESADGEAADLIEGISEIQPGEIAIVLIGNAADTADFGTVWRPVTDLSNVSIGFTDGAGLGGGGDAVALWVGNPKSYFPVDTASYPDAAAFDGQSYDVSLAAFSVKGNANNAVETFALGGDSATVPNVGSPGNKGKINIGIEENITVKFSIYPNPSNGLVTINPSKSIALNQVVVYNLQGSVVYKQNLTSHGTFEMDLRSLTPSVYLISIQGDKVFETKRIVLH